VQKANFNAARKGRASDYNIKVSATHFFTGKLGKQMTYAEITAQNRLLYEAAERCTVEMKLFFQYSPEWTGLYVRRRDILKQIDQNLEEAFRKIDLKRGVKKQQHRIFQAWQNSNYRPTSEIAAQTGWSANTVSRAISGYLKGSKCG